MGFYLQHTANTHSTILQTIYRLNQIQDEILVPMKKFLSILQKRTLPKSKSREADILVKKLIFKYFSLLNNFIYEIRCLNEYISQYGCSKEFLCKLNKSDDIYRVIFPEESVEDIRNYIEKFQDEDYVNRVMLTVDNMTMQEIFDVIEKNREFILKIFGNVNDFLTSLKSLNY